MRKTNLFQTIRKLFWTGMTVSIALAGLLFAQQNPRLEAVVMLKPGVVTLPQGKKEIPLDQARIFKTEIRTALMKHNVRTVSKAFPRFSLSDTLGISRTGRRVRLANLGNIFVLKVTDTTDVKALIKSIKNLPEVIYAEPNFHDYRADGFPNDPHYQSGEQWALNNSNDADIDAPEAWQITTGSNVMIGIIDDGVDASHEDLTGKVNGDAGVYGGNQSWSFGHGTHVAGIAAAIGNNGKGIAGVN